jgi:hypothetical protein
MPRRMKKRIYRQYYIEYDPESRDETRKQGFEAVRKR